MASSGSISKDERTQPQQQPVLASVVSASSSPSPAPASASTFPSSSSSSLSSSSGSSSPSPFSASHSPRGARGQHDPDAARVKHRNNETTRRRQMQKQFNRLRALTGAGRKEDRVSILSKAIKQLEHCMRVHGGAHAATADELQEPRHQQGEPLQQAAQQADAAAVQDLSGLPLSLSFGSSGLNAMLPVEQESTSQQLMLMQPLPHASGLSSYGSVPMSPSSSSSSPAAFLFHTASFLPPSIYSRQSTFVYGMESGGQVTSAASLSSASSAEHRLRSPSPEPFTLPQTSSLSSSLTHSTASLDLVASLMKQERVDSTLSQQTAPAAAGSEAYGQQHSSSRSSSNIEQADAGA